MKNLNLALGIGTGIALAIALTVSAQIDLKSIDQKQIEMKETMEATVSKDIVFERLPIYDDIQYLVDTERGNICYIYREKSISCVKS